ncbi:sensor histidine kinase [Janthinobacterium sp. B9-8]|uniref:sensor histidine kinase n=1 Tax=Janthinobacterium sp. B9-8 TaxID=1236179 RepID=UPI00069987FD|nr:histidine kinase [Janthinobacterium sp. B9-8]AMC33859.1 hypothetical protein VN23_04215 [Janthinobacterium sp. B9-8]
MKKKNLEIIKAQLNELFEFSKIVFDRLAVWVIQLSWGKFIFFVIFLLILGSAIEDGINGVKKAEYPVTPPEIPAAGTSLPHDAAEKKSEKLKVLHDKIRALEVIQYSELSQEDKDELADAVYEVLSNFDTVSSPKPLMVTHLEVNDFVFIFILMLLGIKVLMGGKKRAEALAREAQKESERESLLRQVAEAKIQMMQAQIEPHFLFNTLASVEYLIETDPPRASAMQRSLIQYLRQVLPQIRDHATSNHLGREADMVAAYLELLKMRMEERLEFNIHIPEGLRSAAFPPMILQTLVENAIKHGLEPKTEGGSLSVHAEIAHQKLRISVVDNGLGFGMAKSGGTGLGLQNIRERLALLYKGNSLFSITENQPSGVCITIEVPYTLAA